MQSIYQAHQGSSSQHSDEAVLGILGFPLKQTLSPVFQNAWLKKNKIPLQYKIFSVTPEQLEPWWENVATKAHWLGLNVTVPYKKEIYKKIINLKTPNLSAVNCIYQTQNQTLNAANTDWQGLQNVWRAWNWPFCGSENEKGNTQAESHQVAVIFGAGGSALAANYACQQNIIMQNNTLKKVYQLTRNSNLLEVLNSQLISLFPNLNDEQKPLKISWINATPLGWQAQDTWPTIWEINRALRFLAPHFKNITHFAMDLNYPDTWQWFQNNEVDEAFWNDPEQTAQIMQEHGQQAQTLFLQQFKKIPQVTCLNGLPLLLEQGRLSFKNWFGIDPLSSSKMDTAHS